MNQDQVLSAIRSLLVAAGPLILATGVIPAAGWNIVLAVVPSIGAAIWGVFAHNTSNTLNAAAALTGGVPISVSNSAPPAVRALADDPNVKTVERALPLQGR